MRLPALMMVSLVLFTGLLAGCISQDKPSPAGTIFPHISTVIPDSGIPDTQSGFPSAIPSPSMNPAMSSPQTVVAVTVPASPIITLIPSGEFEMGDHISFVDPQHPSDEIPVHGVRLSQFYMGKFDVTVSEYCRFLNSSFSQNAVVVSSGLVYLTGGQTVLFQTRQADQFSRIGWDGSRFSILDNRGDHPVTSIMWQGAAAYCNWFSLQNGYQPCYNPTSWDCDFTQNGYRLPTEAEWEYAARGGQYTPYYNYPWGNSADPSGANWPGSGDPYEKGPLPWTTPVGFYNGQLHRKADFSWPGDQQTYQTSNGVNGFGLYDMAGNVWQWCNDWYGRDYYRESPVQDPTGPALSGATPMPDGKVYHVLRGGNWYNGESDITSPQIDNGHSRVSNRDPAYYRGPQDPNHPYYHVGFRIVRRS
jgi:formylglycine-generating enzyme required for sulfatase activity